MLFLTPAEEGAWASMAHDALHKGIGPRECASRVRAHMIPPCYFYIGTYLAAHGRGEQALSFLEEGALSEDPGVSSCAYFIGYLDRHGGKLDAPRSAFADPEPFLHFASVPVMKRAREAFLLHAGHSLPQIRDPLRIIDIGCGDGSLTAAFLRHLIEGGTIQAAGEVLLVDSSPAMLALARKNLSEGFPDATVTTLTSRIQDVSGSITTPYHVAMSSLAYHHMPLEEKRMHLARIAPHIDHFLLFEMEANHDTPDLFSPALALSIYQSYGRLIDFTFSHDAPVEIALRAVDTMLMAEIVSFFTMKRGDRSDYHMTKGQWHTLFRESLGPAFVPGCDSTAYADEYVALFTMHYRRDGLP